MSAFRRYILLALLTGFSGPGFPTAARAAGTAPDAPDFNFTHYNSGNSELPYDRVNKIVQDSQGFIWFGTSSGLSRFDGIRFRNYTKEEMGLKSAYVIALCTDSEGNLWIGTDLGVSVYDVDRDRFEPFLRESDLGTVIRNKANVIRRGPDGVMWISVNNQGLFAYDPRTQTLRNHFFENGRQTLPVNIRALHVDGDNGLWIGLFYHSFLYIGHDSADHPRRDDAREIAAFRNDNVAAVSSAPDDSETIYVASARRGLCLLNRSSGRIRTLIPVPSRGFTPEDLYVDREGIVWMSTSEGVYRYDPRTDSARKLACDSHNRFSLSDSHAFAVFIDASDGIWIGTNVGGVNYCGAFQQQFEKYHAADGRSLEDCLVRGFADDGAGHIWIATENEGLLLYDTERRTLNRVVHDQLPNTQFSICCEPGALWLGTDKGLYRLDTRTRAVREYETLGYATAMLDQRVFAIHRTAKGELFVGTTVGLLHYDRRKEAFDPIEGFEGVFVTGMDEDERQRLWVSTYANGLICYDLQRGEITANHIGTEDDPGPLNMLFSVFAGPGGGHVWTTSFNGGFGCLDTATGRFESYDTRSCDLLPTNIFFQVLEDHAGTVWVSSDKGLFAFNPQTKAIRRFTIFDGLLNNDFKNCGLRSADGDLYFGSRSGFIRFNPEKFDRESGDPRLVVTEFRIGNELVVPSDYGRSPLVRNVDRTRSIHLSPRQNSFGFGFAVLNSTLPQLNTVECRLVGYDTQWRRTVADNTIFYYNVPAGTYSLEIRSLASGTAQPIGHEPLSIVVEQRFYKSTAAIGLYLLLFAGVLIAAFKVYYKRAIAREKRKHENYKKQKEAELFQQKLTFFSNIVHEIKTPLTVIHTPLQQIQASGHLSPADRDNLQAICNGTHYLDQLVRELLDFVRVEKRGYKLDCKPMNIVERTGFLCSTFQETAKARNLRLSFTAERDNIRIDADESAMNKILNNLLHNALKYAESYIEVNVRSHDGTATVSITNDGEPISPEQRSEIFKPFVQYDKSPGSRSFGIGLSLARSLAEMHAGTLELADDTLRTTFVLTLPAAAPLPETAAGQEPPAPQDRSLPLLLLVEDNRELTAYLKHKLDADYRVIAVHAAEKAVGVLQEQEVDIVVTDIALPGTNGIELCRTISSDFDLSHIPVIVTSAISDTATKIACMEAGASTYIEKPFGLDYLEACIRAILDKRARLKKSYQNTQEPLDPKQFGLHSADEEFLRRIDELIMQHLNEPAFSSKQIEEALFLSRSTLIRKVRALLDTTPNDYLRSKRLSIAAQLLAQNKCRISEVCFSVGFNSPSYFAKCFKEQFGVSPAEYQKQ